MEPPLKAKSKAFPQLIRSKMKKSTSYSWLQDKKTQLKSQDKMISLELPKTAPPVPPQSSKATEQDKKEDYSYYYSSSSSSSSETPPPVALSDTARDTLNHIAKVLMTKAQDPNITISEFAAYLIKNSLEPLPPTSFTPEKPFKVLVISGCSKSGKSTVSNLIPSFFKAQRATTSSNKYCKYVADERGRLGFNILVFSNDELRTNNGLDIGWDRMHQSLNSVTQNTPGLSLVIIEGHRLWQNQGIIELAQYITWLSAKPSVLRKRGCTPESLNNYTERLQPFVDSVQKSRTIYKLDSGAPPHVLVKKMLSFIVLKDKGFSRPGQALSDLLELHEFCAVPQDLYDAPDPPSAYQSCILCFSTLGNNHRYL